MIQESVGVILAGGKSSRFGSSKAMAPWGKGPLIEAVADVLSSLFPWTLVLVKNSEGFSLPNKKNLKVARDLVPEFHSLGAIYSALCQIETDRIFVCGCDMPFLQPQLVESLWRASGGYDVTVPLWQGKSQSLCGFYSQKCKGAIEEMMKEKDFAIHELFIRVLTRFFLEEEVRAVDPEGLSFWDIDTRKEYDRARVYHEKILIRERGESGAN